MNLIYYPDERLKKKSEEISSFNKSIKHIIKGLLDNIGGGVGISAPQLGINKRILIYLDEFYKPKVMINPIITSAYGGKKEMEEGCLSCPGEFVLIERDDVIEVKYKDEYFINKTKTFEGIVARIIQHEIDHLEGICIVDYVKQNN